MIGRNPRIPFTGNSFQARIFADGRGKSEYHSATSFPFHYLYENRTLKAAGGAPVRPAVDFNS